MCVGESAREKEKTRGREGLCLCLSCCRKVDGNHNYSATMIVPDSNVCMHDPPQPSPSLPVGASLRTPQALFLILQNPSVCVRL